MDPKMGRMTESYAAALSANQQLLDFNYLGTDGINSTLSHILVGESKPRALECSPDMALLRSRVLITMAIRIT